MAKKKMDEEATTNETPFDEPLPEEGEGLSDMDFNVEDEYKPDPLIVKGTYNGAVTKVVYEGSKACITWTVCLHDNGGVMNDGQTPVDGAHVFFRNWLPRPGDEEIMTKSGKNTKRQSKINMLKKFADDLRLDMSTPTKIATALAEQQWVGLEVAVDVDIDEYNGTFRNNVNNMRASKSF